jgi:trimeric autotransporter adhesin
MKSFKKIALAMVAAMTLGTMVATPASANTMSVVATTWNAAKVVSGVVTPGYDTPATAGTALTTAIVRPVPADNTIDNADVIKLEATVVAGTNVTATATNATLVSALHSTAAPVGASSGSSTLTVATGTGTTATFYVYTKTTAIGTVVITNGPVTLTYYVQGTAGLINNLSVSAPATGAAGTKQEITVTATDAFGNKVSGKSITATVFAATATLDTVTVSTGATLSDFGVATFKATLPTSGTRSLITFAPTTAGDAVAAAVVGLTAPTLAPFAEIAVRDLVSELASEKAAKDAALAAKAVADAAVLKAAADAVTAKAAADKALADAKVAADAALVAAVKVETDKAAAAKVASDAALAAKDAQIAKLTADNAAALKSIKSAFNALAKKWNAKNPKAKVTLVK